MRTTGHTLLLALATVGLVAGCRYPAGTYPLKALPGSEVDLEKVAITPLVELEHTPTTGWDLSLQMQVRAELGVRPLVDLSRTMLRSDQVRWMSCTLPADMNVEDLRIRLYEEENIKMQLRCLDIQRPEERLELRIPISGTGSRAYVEMTFCGVSGELEAESMQLD